MNTRRVANAGVATMALGKIVGERTDSTRFLRGAELMERSMVTTLTVTAGQAKATVRGSRREAYAVVVTSRTPGLLPMIGSDLRFTCSCPDWGDPCKHGVAVTLELAERLDDDPALLTRFLGLSVTTSTPRPRTATVATAAADLPTTAPTWVNEVRVGPPPTDAESFFGRRSAAGIVGPGATVSGPATIAEDGLGEAFDPTEVLGRDRLRALGPLLVDGFDIAPELLRLFTTLTLATNPSEPVGQWQLPLTGSHVEPQRLRRS